MTKNNDLQNAIDNIHNALIECNRGIITALASSQGFNSNAGAQWVEYANQLQRLIPAYAAPKWLIHACNEFGLKLEKDIRR